MLSWEYPPLIAGGMGQHVQELVPALLAADPTLELHLATPMFGDRKAPESEHRERHHVHRIPVVKPASETYFQDMHAANARILLGIEELHATEQRFGGFDLVHTHDWLTGFAARAYSAAHGLPLVATIHATERGRLRGHVMHELERSIDGAERELVQEAQQLITCSIAMAHEVERYFGVAAAEIHIIPNGVRSDRYDRLRTTEHSDFRQRYADPDEEVVFNVGRLVYEKGSDLLVEAAAKVLGQRPKTKFVIGGTGPLLGRLENRLRELGLEQRVLLTGFLSDEDRDRLYLLASCCVFPSRYEPFGIVALESMAAGTPVVVTNVGGLGTVVTHNETGITVFPDDVDSLAWGILRTLEEPEAARLRAAQACQAVRELFSWSHIAQLTLVTYAEAVAAVSPHSAVTPDHGLG
jgi:glycosyltransferase involved in cell wall biosynthesis